MESAPISTPAFLLWAIEYSCPIRGFQNGSDPDHAERQLRAAIALSTARREGRVFEGYCIEPPLGFRIDDALAIYGGVEAVERTCGACVANAVSRIRPGELAGCLGMFVLPEDAGEFYRRMDEVVVQAGLAEECSRLFPSTEPRWHGFWFSSRLTGEQTGFLATVSAQLSEDGLALQGLNDLRAGLGVAAEQGLAFHASLYPSGCVQNREWRLVPHCPRCKAAWALSGRGRCLTCGYEGHPAPNKKRSVRGRRPYLPLERMMGENQAEAIMNRYLARK